MSKQMLKTAYDLKKPVETNQDKDIRIPTLDAIWRGCQKNLIYTAQPLTPEVIDIILSQVDTFWIESTE